MVKHDYTVGSFFESLQEREDYFQELQARGDDDRWLRAGMQLIEVLLSQREEIEEWINRYAGSQGELRGEPMHFLPDPWVDLLERFAPGLKGVDLPDMGQHEAMLKEALDQLALGRQVRLYAY